VVASGGIGVTIVSGGTPFVMEGLVPPTPGPLDRQVEEDDGFDSFSSPYTAAKAHLVVRILARNNDDTLPDVAVAWGATPLTEIVTHGVAEAGTSWAGAYYAEITPGTQNLTVTVANGSLGHGFLRVGELTDVSGIGATAVSVNDITSNDYYAELDFEAAAGSIVGAIVGWQNANAYPIYPSRGYDMVQWETWMAQGANSSAARFAMADGPNDGEGGGLWVYYANGGNQFSPIALLFELEDAVL
jgi:hypothetical protein